MDFEIGDKVLTVTGLYISGEWRERGLKGKVVDKSTEFGGLLTVKFKGIEELRFLRPDYVILRKKAEVKRPFVVGDTVALKEPVYTYEGSARAGADAEVLEVVPDSNLVVIEFLNGGELTVAEEVLTKTEVVADESPEELDAPERERPFEVGDSVVFTKDVVTGGLTVAVTEGIWAEVIELIPDSNLVVVQFDDGGELTVAEEVLASEEETFGEEEDVPDLHEVRDNPEVQAALALVLERIEEIKGLLTQGPRTEFVVNVHPSAGLDALDVVAATLKQKKEEPAPEPVFKKAKEVLAGDLLYTEAGAYDKVDRIDTKASGYTSLYGVFGNKIAQVPSGRVVQVLEEVS